MIRVGGMTFKSQADKNVADGDGDVQRKLSNGSLAIKKIYVPVRSVIPDLSNLICLM